MKAVLTFIFAGILFSGTAQTYMYIDGAEIIPESPVTTSDLVSIRLTGNFSDTGGMVESYDISLDGTTVNIEITAYSEGGAAVLTPFDITWEMDMYDVGIYDVEITGTGIGVAVEGPVEFEVVVDASGLPAFDNNTPIQIYPNPTNGAVWVERLADENDYSVAVFTLGGQLVLTEKLQKPITRLDMSGLEEGLYFIQVRNRNGLTVKRQKIVVRK